MATFNGIQLQAEPVRSLEYNAITIGYEPIGSATVYPSRIIFIQNQTNAALMFSLDGTNDHFPLAASAFLLLDVASDQELNQGFYLPVNTTFYVKEIGTPTSGYVYVSVFYGNSGTNF